jgi:hypothetical protein
MILLLVPGVGMGAGGVEAPVGLVSMLPLVGVGR